MSGVPSLNSQSCASSQGEVLLLALGPLGVIAHPGPALLKAGVAM